MDGARKYAGLFKTGQYDRLYLVSGSHARGKTFRIFVLPAGEAAKPNGERNPPLNKDAVEVYGITGGQSGWTETYGWLIKGKWQSDFELMAANRKAEIEAFELAKATFVSNRNSVEEIRIAGLLSAYPISEKQGAEVAVPAVATVGAVKSVEHMDADLRIAILSCADVALGITSRDRARAFVCVLSGYLAEIGESEIAEKMTVLLDGRGA